jgi:DNA-damage-inducible protein J
MTTVNVRIEEKTKKAASKVFSDIGMDMSSGIKVFLRQVVNENGLPFKPTKIPAEIRAQWERGIAEARKNGKVYKSVDEVLADL